MADKNQLSEVIVRGETDNVIGSLGVQSIVNPDEYFLEKVEILTSTGPVNLKGVMVELSYYEDIFRGTLTGHILIHDAISLIDRLALNGTETLTLSYKKSSQASYRFKRNFRVFRVGERILNNNAQEVYTLHFCSEELFLSEQLKISKAYTGKKISEIVTDILENEMKINKDRLIIEPTLNLYDFIIPYKKPFEAINWLASYARPTRNPGADFLFFEDVLGFNFRSLQTMYSLPAYRTFIYNLRTAGKRQNSGEIGNSLVGIKSYNFLDTFDTLYATNLGAFSNKTISIDPLTRSYYTTVFNYSTYLKNSKTLNSNTGVISSNKNALGKAAFENENAVLKVLTTNKEQKQALGIKGVAESSVANDTGVEIYVPNRTAQIAMSHYSRIKIAVSGDPQLTVGQTLNIILPSMRGPDGTGYQTGEKDEYHSGKYIVTAVRHIIDVNLKYETVLEIAKDSLGAKLPATTKSTSEIINPNSDPSAPVSGGVSRNN